MSLEEKLANLEALIAEMEYVQDGDWVFTKHPNIFVDYLTDAVDVCKELYEMFKTKTGETLPDVELWLSMAESRREMMRKALFGDLVYTRDHNLIIDVMKPLEMVIKEIDENL